MTISTITMPRIWTIATRRRHEPSGPSRERRYYDSHGMYIGCRDEEGWVHAEGGRNYIGRIDDDGTFYDGSGMYRGQVDLHDGSGYCDPCAIPPGFLATTIAIHLGKRIG